MTLLPPRDANPFLNTLQPTGYIRTPNCLHLDNASHPTCQLVPASTRWVFASAFIHPAHLFNSKHKRSNSTSRKGPSPVHQPRSMRPEFDVFNFGLQMIVCQGCLITSTNRVTAKSLRVASVLSVRMGTSISRGVALPFMVVVSFQFSRSHYLQRVQNLRGNENSLALT